MKFRHVKWWLAELLNRGYFPDWVFRQYRRDEISNCLKDARKGGIPIKRNDWIFGSLINKILARAPKRAK